MTPTTSGPPTMAGWNLALRFVLELAALVGLALAAWRLPPAPWRWIAVVAVPLVAAAAWGTFNVVGDPSRSGAAPVEVPGWARLCVEAAVLGAGVVALALVGWAGLALVDLALVLIHYAVSWSRVRWLLGVRRPA